jgi:raffinose/stachyose/melibiose transport system permease protein
MSGIHPRRAASTSDGARHGRGLPSSLAHARRRAFIPFVGPALAMYAVFIIGPVGYAIWLSLHDWAGFGDSTWVGGRNYQRLLADSAFQTAMLNTLKLLAIVGGCTFLLSFILTMVLREMRGRLLARNILFFPNVVNGIVFGIMAGFLFNPDGLVNTVLKAIGITEPPRWLARENLFPLIMAVLVWSATGYYTTIIMAGVDRIPAYLYEECDLAGANAFQRLRHVTLPLTWDVLTVCALLWTISSVKIFELLLVFGGSKGLPPTETWSVAVYSYAEAFGGLGTAPRYGMACASALTSLALVAVIVLGLRRLLDRESVQF